MSRAFPSMTALLGLIAVAGFQNRDKIAEMLGAGTKASSGAPGQAAGEAAAPSDALGGLLGHIKEALGGAGSGDAAGTVVHSGLGELMDSFKQAGQGEAAQSWVSKGPNHDIAPPDLEQAIGPDMLATLSHQTGLSREELLSRLSKNLPQAVDQYTPEGRLPQSLAGSHA